MSRAIFTRKAPTKKTSHCNSRALFTRKAPTKNTILFFINSNLPRVPLIFISVVLKTRNSTNTFRTKLSFCQLNFLGNNAFHMGTKLKLGKISKKTTQLVNFTRMEIWAEITIVKYTSTSTYEVF